MAAMIKRKPLLFPAEPKVGDVYPPRGKVQWVWTGDRWIFTPAAAEHLAEVAAKLAAANSRPSAHPSPLIERIHIAAEQRTPWLP